MTKALIAILLSAVATLCACSGAGEQVATPRPTAYPRVAVADSIFETISGLAIHFEANTSTQVTVKDDSSFDIYYPDYDATLYCTATPATDANRRDILANREVRMALNVGDNNAEIISLSAPSGFDSRIVICRESAALPLQFLSSDNHAWVVSGALFLNRGNSATATDSISPIIDAVQRDIIHSLKTICSTQR